MELFPQDGLFSIPANEAQLLRKKMKKRVVLILKRFNLVQNTP